MDNKKIISELNRIKYLFLHERGVVISEQTKIPQQLPDSSKNPSNKTVTSQETTSTKKEGSETVISKTKTDTIKLSERFTATYTEESDDPSNFLTTAYQKIIDRLNQENPERLSILITRANIIGTASNFWRGPTKYDSDKDYKYLGGEQPQTPTEVTLDGRTIKFNNNYKLNKNLAYKRANVFWTKLLSKLQAPPSNPTEKPIIKLGTSVTPTISQMVVNTGGQNDNFRNKDKYPNPGQTVLIELDFIYEKKMVEVQRIPGVSIEVSGSISTSTYWCDGTDGTGKWDKNKYQFAQAQCGGKRDDSALIRGGQFNTSVLNGVNTGESPRVKGIAVGTVNSDKTKLTDIVWTKTKNDKMLKYPEMVSTEHDYIIRYSMNYGTWEFKWQDYTIVEIKRKPTELLNKVIKIPDGVVGVSSKEVGNILSDKNKTFYLQELMTSMNLKKSGEDAYRASFDYYVRPYIQ